MKHKTRLIVLLLFINLTLPFAHSAPITLLTTGKTLGLFEQCACGNNPEGGLEARASVVEKLRHDYPEALLFDLGQCLPENKVDPASPFTMKNERDILRAMGKTTAKAFSMMKYDAVLAGWNELTYGADYLKETFTDNGLTLLSSNAEADNPNILLDKMIRETQGITLGFVGLSCRSSSRNPSRDIHLAETTQRITTLVRELKETSADVIIMLAHMPPITFRKWLNTYNGPPIDIAITLDFGITIEHEGNTLITNAPGRGRAVGQLQFDVTNGHVSNPSYTRVSIKPSEHNHPVMRDFLTQSYKFMSLKLGLQINQDHQVNPIESDNAYIGAKACAECHQEQFDQWSKTKHARAYDQVLSKNKFWIPALAKRYVTGFLHPTGYQDFSDFEQFANIQCEVCHGPGRKHQQAEGVGFIQQEVNKALCVRCHTPDFTPRFNSRFDLYLKQVKH